MFRSANSIHVFLRLLNAEDYIFNRYFPCPNYKLNVEIYRHLNLLIQERLSIFRLEN